MKLPVNSTTKLAMTRRSALVAMAIMTAKPAETVTIIPCINYKTCLVCHDETLAQNEGIGQFPEEISLRVLQVLRRTNRYYQALNRPDYTLASCNDQSDMCAF